MMGRPSHTETASSTFDENAVPFLCFRTLECNAFERAEFRGLLVIIGFVAFSRPFTVFRYRVRGGSRWEKIENIL